MSFDRNFDSNSKEEVVSTTDLSNNVFNNKNTDNESSNSIDEND